MIRRYSWNISIMEWVNVADGLSILEREVMSNKVKTRNRREAEERKKAERKQQKDVNEAEKRITAVSKNDDDIKKGLDHVISLTCQRKRDILIYSFNLEKKVVGRMKLIDLNDKIKEVWPMIPVETSNLVTIMESI